MGKQFGLILAAGQGTRMKSKQYKVLHKICGKPMVEYVVDRLKQLQMDEIVVIVGFGAEAVKKQLGERAKYVIQEEQLGTAHAVLQAKERLANEEGTTLVVCGDTPLITSDTLEKMRQFHEYHGLAATILTTYINDPTGYGRIIRQNDQVERIVEEKDASDDEKKIREINTGIYCFNNKLLFEALSKVNNENAQGEYYLTDVIEILRNDHHPIGAYVTEDPEEMIGINDRVALSKAEDILRKRICREHMKNGVTIINPDHTYIEPDVLIGRDTIIYPGTFLKGSTVIGENCIIGPNADIKDGRIGNEVHFHYSVMLESEVGDKAKVGPFTYIRPGSSIGSLTKVGDFVEIKNSTLGTGSKVSHLSYIGDADVGENVNVGCGAITVNYDGVNKHRTHIKDGAFIGCNTNLVAPVTIGEDAYVAAGSTITEDVPDKALGIARERQTNKLNYTDKKKKD
ncbi:bifunctional UDP-N-acetylglucosamine diphosphorylase/glucosamine-1-phosphate N-acetyltransferase GlmU [Microaerobacter geothermalis]|uniref:bifunctional UDP-N-acetylglucosamine diphosphorylase/glucosamine-1-phosphate N-acetyltransferase GlmU n=1 Tax=Microaerobacter geothermalis TaxID=674972 RepID=UPI001F3D1E9B|nr:bifunctional UDP-N-acetylglucosamine diphosphorylase/glucosamine-1-phosphate N-acetyltransferase GlmU [Microaerobacter geothermalis]MCF6094702.1 bifunctional UDP-N-acetylglucosamine diphosphorylase/glucosamine-1-phosphate N-acetyltransferase GlmU [Microaerobacter geothermalis]